MVVTNSVVLHRERRLLVPPDEHPWWRSHAQTPTVLPISDTTWRVFFSGRDAENRSHIIYADVDPTRDMELIRLHSEPLLALGPPGCFDSSGIAPSAALFVGDRLFLYYVGIALRRDVPHQTAIGLAVSEDGGDSFRRATAGPVLGVGPFEPYSTMFPHVTLSGGVFLMHYVSAISWERPNSGWPRYAIKRAHSTDGISWVTEERITLGSCDETEAVVARPWIIPRQGFGEMWFCCRGWPGEDRLPVPPYRLAYARCEAGSGWERHDELLRFDNPPQPEDWDSTMQAYPCAVLHRNQSFLFYNGNGFGKSGIGFARVLE